MVDVLRQPHHPGAWATRDTSPVPGSGLARELRQLAEELAGCPDRDELTMDEESLLADELDAAVAVVAARVRAQLEIELGPRVESLPLHARMALLRTRERRQLGLE